MDAQAEIRRNAEEIQQYLAGLNDWQKTLSSSSNSTIDQTSEELKEQALNEKTLGNQCFQSGKYDEALEHYSKGIELHPANATLYLNRAMAYIKSLKFNAAVKDCTECIRREPKNVKAYWRRYFALKSLGRYGEARKDIEHALVLDPTNQSFKSDYQGLLETIKNPPRRRIPIEEIGQPPVPVKSKPSDPPASNRQMEVAAVKIVAERPAPTNTPLPACPKTVFEFERDWKTVLNDPKLVYQYLRQIPSRQFPTLFKSCLQPNHLSLFIKALSEYFLVNDGPKVVFEFLENLAQTQRFQMNLMFLNAQDKQVLKDLFRLLNDSGEVVTTALRSAYKQ